MLAGVFYCRATGAAYVSSGDGGSALFPAVTGAPMTAPKPASALLKRRARVGCAAGEGAVTEINARGRFVAQTQTARSGGMAKVPVIDIDLYKIDQNNNPDNRPFATVLALIDTGSNGCAIDIQQAANSNLLPIGQSTFDHG